MYIIINTYIYIHIYIYIYIVPHHELQSTGSCECSRKQRSTTDRGHAAPPDRPRSRLRWFIHRFWVFGSSTSWGQGFRQRNPRKFNISTHSVVAIYQPAINLNMTSSKTFAKPFAKLVSVLTEACPLEAFPFSARNRSPQDAKQSKTGRADEEAGNGRTCTALGIGA